MQSSNKKPVYLRLQCLNYNNYEEGGYMKIKFWVIFVLIVLWAIVLSVGGVHAQTTNVLKVGSVLPLNFGMGVDTKNALEMLAADFNAAGGIVIKGQRYNVQLIVYDDKWTAEAGRAAVERLVHQDKIKYLISTISSPTILSGLALFEQEKILNLAAGASPKILDPSLRFTFGASTVRTSLPPVWTAARKIWPNAKTVAFLAPNDEGGRARAIEEKQVAEAFGMKVLDTLYYPRSTTDFSSLGLKAKSYNPDLVDYPGTDAGTQFGLQIKAVYAAGFRGGQVSAIGPKMEEVKAVTSNESLEGLLAKMGDTELANPPPVAKAFKERVIKTYGKWSDASLPWIPAWFALIEAIKKADSVDPTVIADYLTKNGLEWQRVDGKAMLIKRPDLKNMEFCDSISEAQYGQVKNGQLVPVARLTLPEVLAACEKVFGAGLR
jgi:branched-chain amino acid transport system substrate-binding protein